MSYLNSHAFYVGYQKNLAGINLAKKNHHTCFLCWLSKSLAGIIWNIIILPYPAAMLLGAQDIFQATSTIGARARLPQPVSLRKVVDAYRLHGDGADGAGDFPWESHDFIVELPSGKHTKSY